MALRPEINPGIFPSARSDTPGPNGPDPVDRFTGFYPIRALTQSSDTAGTSKSTELLPFRITLARTEAQLRRAVSVRASAFGRKSLELATALGEPEPADRSADSVVIIAEDKVTGDPIGTMRIASNLQRPMDIEAYDDLPDALVGRRIARAERLGVTTRRNASLVKVALFKALHRYCLALQIEWIVVQVTPPRDKDYRALGFFEILPDVNFESFILPGTRQICLALNAESAERRFHAVDHMLYRFMFATWHPDIDVFSSVRGEWARPREDDRSVSTPSRHLSATGTV